MRTIVKTPNCSYRIGTTSKGCSLCVQGKKTVLFVTGLCPRRCFYCPISENKYQKDVIYANERQIKNTKELIEEAAVCSSTGAGITGGDPLVKADRTASFIQALKKRFGEQFHIHLYTPLELVTEKTLKKLHTAGLDEIRFQPDMENNTFWKRLQIAISMKWDVGVEIPVIPGWYQKTVRLIRYCDSIGIDFLNLNELEISDTNAQKLLEHGFAPKDDISYGVKGSEKLAMKLLDFCKKNTNLRVHYCTTTLKDRVQLAKRIKRRAQNVHKPYDKVTVEGMLVRGAVYTKETFPGLYKKKPTRQDTAALQKTRERLIKRFKVPSTLVEVDKKQGRLLLSIARAKIYKKYLKEQELVPCIVAEYPTYDHMIVELGRL